MHLAETRAIDVVAKPKQQPEADKMQLKTILNHVEKQKGFVYTAVRFDEDKSAILVSLKPHRRSRPVCSGCGKKSPGYDTRSERRFEFVPLWGITVFLVYAMRRVDCPTCGVKVEQVPWADGKHRSTYSYRIFLASWAGHPASGGPFTFARRLLATLGVCANGILPNASTLPSRQRGGSIADHPGRRACRRHSCSACRGGIVPKMAMTSCHR